MNHHPRRPRPDPHPATYHRSERDLWHGEPIAVDEPKPAPPPPEPAPSSPTHWTRAMVERRMLEACRVFERIVRGDDVSGFARDVPQGINIEQELMGIHRARIERLELEGYINEATGEMKKAVELNWGRRPPPERIRISMAEQAMGWPKRYVADDRERVCLSCFILLRAERRQGFPRAVNMRFAKQFLPSVSKPRAYQLKDSALAAIAAGLTQDAVAWRECDAAP